MNRRINDIKDDEFRVIGVHSTYTPEGRPKHSVLWTILIVTVLIIVVLLCVVLTNGEPKPVQDVFDTSTLVSEGKDAVIATLPLGNYEDTVKAYTEHLHQTVNDIPISIYIPHNAVPRLSMGTPDMYDKNIILTAQAADIRADNGKINGAFVLAGRPLAWGLSKKGYVAIIDGKVSIGVAENSPLFEEATEKGGYFFRQYALVDNGSLVENESKGKSIRKAICDRAGEVFIAITETPESFHDFSQALVDLGVRNAVYIVGSEFSYGYFRDKFDHLTQLCSKRRGGQKYENYIEWRNVACSSKMKI